jgi:hypothetical protein
VIALERLERLAGLTRTENLLEEVGDHLTRERRFVCELERANAVATRPVCTGEADVC